MHRGDLSIVTSTLNHSYQTLCRRWDDTLSVWSDPVSARFDEGHLAPMAPEVASFMKAVNRLSQAMARAVEDCT